MKSVSVAVVMTVMLTWAMAAPVRAQITMQIVGPGSRISAIAVSALKNLGGDDQGAISNDFAATLDRDLVLSGYFRVIGSQAYIEDAQASGYQFGQFNFADWRSINAEFLVKGAATVQGESVTIEALLYDVAQQRQLSGKRFTGGRNEVRRMARRFADAVLKATTGVQGPFDSVIAEVSTRGGRFKEVYTMSLDGRDIYRITNNPTINLFPSLSANGRSLLYVSYKSGEPALYLADLDGHSERMIRLSGRKLIGGTLAPDGESIVAAAEHGGSTNLYLLDTNGDVLKQLTHGGAINVDPAFSPDGRMLAFTSDRSGTPQIYLMNLGGGTVKRLTYEGSYNTSPAYAPDGAHIAYVNRSGGAFNIFTIPAGGGNPVRMAGGESPCWSPDGRYILFSSGRSGRSRLYLMMAANGKIISPITEDAGNDTSPTWSGWLGK